MPERDIQDDELVTVGFIAGAHGIRGEVKVESRTDFPGRFDPGSRLLLVDPRGGSRPAEILSSRVHKGRYLLFLDGVVDRTGAEALRGWSLGIPAGELSPLPPGRYYHFQLEGLRVRSDEGEDLGSVTGVIETGANLVLDVRGPAGAVLLPFIDDVILRVDLETGELRVHLLPGLRPE